MTLAVFADDEQWNEIKKDISNVEWIRLTSLTNIPENIAGLFILFDFVEINYTETQVPIFINSVANTLMELKAPAHVVRINGWNGFLSRAEWEISGIITEQVIAIINSLNKKITILPDEPGFISARILAMIINEAWFALGENVSTKKEIDIAMKLGTNYPLGPFEWGEKIGEKNIFVLLKKLSKTNKKYLPAPLLQQKITE